MVKAGRLMNKPIRNSMEREERGWGLEECWGGLNSARELFDILAEERKTLGEGAELSGRKETEERKIK